MPTEKPQNERANHERSEREEVLRRLSTLPRQQEDIADIGPPDDATRPGKTSDSNRRQDLPPDV